MVRAPVRVAVIGSGFVAGLHLDALAALPDVEIAGIVDVDASRAAAASRRAGGVPFATELDDALKVWPVDAAIICTPNDTHVQIASTLARAQVHALVEKPLATTPADAATLVEAFRERELVLAAAHTHRFADYALAVKRAVDDGDVGRAVHARVTILGGWIWRDWRNWQLRRDRSGGHALHNGVHLLDLATWWLGDRPVHVHAQGRKQAAPQLEIHDYLLMTVGYASGATAICEISRANRPRGLSFREVFVQGTTGALRLPWDGEAPVVLAEGGGTPVPGGASPFAGQAAAWLAAVRGEEAPRVSGVDGLRAVVLGTAAERSLATGDVIAIADVEREAGP